jgi:hypothetical protein
MMHYQRLGLIFKRVSSFEDTLFAKTNGMPIENHAIPISVYDFHKMPFH